MKLRNTTEYPSGIEELNESPKVAEIKVVNTTGFPSGLDEDVDEALWSGDVETKWHPEEGFFKKGADAIASGLKAKSKDLKQAMGRLNFYINRAGKNMSAEDKSRLEAAKTKLQSLYGEK